MAKPIETDVLDRIVRLLAEIADLPRSSLSRDTPLLGAGAVIRSRELVELLLAVEDFVESDFNAQFDWTSDRAMSTTESAFRTVGTLTDHIIGVARDSQCGP